MVVLVKTVMIMMELMGGMAIETEMKKILAHDTEERVLACNTSFRNGDEHLITYSSGGRTSQLDYILVKQSKAKKLEGL